MITALARLISVRGVVQGVGFRPFVYQLAQENCLKGWVRNTSGDVTILVEGDSRSIDQFLVGLRDSSPPQSHIESISYVEEPVRRYEHFEIMSSLVKHDEYQLISPDLATCSACKIEIFDSSNRRYRYPFTNCTNCGPRFTIIEDIPYDRSRTTMRNFKMCPECQREYDDPKNRRFHAQPNACPVCGPRLELVDSAGKTLNVLDVITRASQLLTEGNILAIKGLGGFLLACDATSDQAVRRLRERKKRLAKPLAVMLKNLEEARHLCHVNHLEEVSLNSPAAPIVLLKMKAGPGISAEVTHGLKNLGVMLPYTPLHQLLMKDIGLPLVMTSGNISEEPIAKDNIEALSRLRHIADYFILHNRDIYSRYDDGVLFVEQDRAQMVRRARGQSPYPIQLPYQSQLILACGAELKNTFCLTRDNHAFVSQHIGDMENEETLEHFENTLRQYQMLFRIQPEIISCDLHPDYLTTRWAEIYAKKTDLPLVAVQHHHAHVASCMVDNGVQRPVIGVAMDGTGYGTDARIWGGEFLIADYQGFQRKAHFEYLPLPGGNSAIHKPYRTAIGYLYFLLGAEALNRGLPCFKGVDLAEIELIKKQVDMSLNSPLTSSCGRLFDAVSSLTGIKQQVSYEGQAAMELEVIAHEGIMDKLYPYSIETKHETGIIGLRDLFSAIVSDLMKGVQAPEISAVFHNTIAHIIVQVSLQLSKETGIQEVALSGGVFQNRRLLNQVTQELRSLKLSPLTHCQVPCNDGGISLGQAVVANFCKGRK